MKQQRCSLVGCKLSCCERMGRWALEAESHFFWERVRGRVTKRLIPPLYLHDIYYYLWSSHNFLCILTVMHSSRHRALPSLQKILLNNTIYSILCPSIKGNVWGLEHYPHPSTMTNHKLNITSCSELLLPKLCLMTLPANTCELLSVTCRIALFMSITTNYVIWSHITNCLWFCHLDTGKAWSLNNLLSLTSAHMGLPEHIIMV